MVPVPLKIHQFLSLVARASTWFSQSREKQNPLWENTTLSPQKCLELSSISKQDLWKHTWNAELRTT